jgi:hypothetical protein
MDHATPQLLKPVGGRILAPVDSDLRVLTVGADGRVAQRVISQVRFSELEVGGCVGVVFEPAACCPVPALLATGPAWCWGWCGIVSAALPAPTASCCWAGLMGSS